MTTSDEYANALGDMAKVYVAQQQGEDIDIAALLAQGFTPQDTTVRRDLRLDVLPVRRSAGLGSFVDASARYETRGGFDPMSIVDRRLYRQLAADVLAHRLPPEQVVDTTRVVFKSPASWWQMFKRDHTRSWWLAWLVRRRPVVDTTTLRVITTTVDVQRFRTFPEADLPYPPHLGRPYHWGSAVSHTRITDDHGGHA